ncbi:MAG: transglutaminase domain-containing protein, partial [Acutalibacteraceae bacterium]
MRRFSKTTAAMLSLLIVFSSVISASAVSPEDTGAKDEAYYTASATPVQAGYIGYAVESEREWKEYLDSQIAEGENTIRPYESGLNPDYDSATEFAASYIVNMAKEGTAETYTVPLYSNGYRIASSAQSAFVNQLYDSRPELFFISTSYGYSTIGSYISSITMRLDTERFTASSVAGAVTAYENKISQIISQTDESWTDLEKVLFVNDYIAAHCVYTSGYYDAYSNLVEGRSVCQGYSAAVIALLSKMNIQVSYAESADMVHIWNIVQIDGEWYQLDCTWNDPTADLQGRAMHTYFLLSDERIGELNHYNWDALYECTSTYYDDYFWQYVRAPFANLNGTLYYIDFNGENSKYLCSCTVSSDSGKTAVSSNTRLYYMNSQKWYSFGTSSFYNYPYSGLGLYKGELYINSPTGFLRFDASDNTASQLAADSALTQALETGYIWGMYMDGDTVYYQMGTSPSNELSRNNEFKVTHTHSCTNGVCVICGDEDPDYSNEPVTPEISDNYYEAENNGYIKTDGQ